MIGWTIAPSPMVEHGDYLIAGATDGAAIAGIATPSERAIATRLVDLFPHQRRRRSRNEGQGIGRLDPRRGDGFPGVGRFAIAMDPQHVSFTLMTSVSPDPSSAFVQAPR